MRGRGERNQVERLEDEVIRLKLLARRLWDVLRKRTGGEIDALFGDLDLSERRAVDRVFDAVETVWEKHKVLIEPCRLVLDSGGDLGWGSPAWPTQGECYLGRWPDGSTRNLTRDQVLMMGGQDPVPSAETEQGVPF